MNKDYLSDAGRRANLAYWAEVQRRQMIDTSKTNQLIKYHLASLSRKRSVVFNSALCDND
jgi:hypothetical protein